MIDPYVSNTHRRTNIEQQSKNEEFHSFNLVILTRHKLMNFYFGLFFNVHTVIVAWDKNMS